MELTLTPDIERALKVQAHQRGVTPEQLALTSLRKAFVRTTTSTIVVPQETLADFRGTFVGLLHSSEHVPGGAQLSEK